MKNHKKGAGFTLIELLVVIAIIAVLSVVVILTLNPAELLRQARDSNRVSDLATLKSAVALFQSDVATSSTSSIGAYGTLYVGSATAPTSTGVALYASTTAAGWGYMAASDVITTSTTSRVITGTGWIPINFSLISSGSPIGNEPADPSNNGVNYYTYAATSTSFK